MHGSTPRRTPPLPSTGAELTADGWVSSKTEDYDALADLFLDGASFSPATPRLASRLVDEGDATVEPPLSAKRELIEAVIVGHLPVLGAAWITQFARHRAIESGGPVALVRLSEGTVSVDLVAESAPLLEGASEASDLSAALKVAGGIARRWIVRVEELLEQSLAVDPRPGSLTLLTGADEAAMVASYRTFKGLLATLGAGPEASGPKLGVAIFGAEPAKAAESEAKLRKAAQGFLGRDLATSCQIQRITTCAVANVFRGRFDEGVDQLMALVESASRSSPSPTQPTAPARPTGGFAMTEPKQPSAAFERAHVPIATPVQVNAPSNGTPFARATQPSTTVARLSLAPLIGGLRTLVARCPYSPSVEFAADASGRLHLIAMHDEPDDKPVRDLISTASWAATHETLLAAAEPGLQVTRDGGPSLHLVCDRAPAMRRMLDSGVRIHLLVTVGSESVCRELN
ncbi:MAG: hypothetical protein ACOYN0_03310 [Phycisphaerales bacterium]